LTTTEHVAGVSDVKVTGNLEVAVATRGFDVPSARLEGVLKEIDWKAFAPTAGVVIPETVPEMVDVVLSQ
jgi:hypothetical protein